VEEELGIQIMVNVTIMENLMMVSWIIVFALLPAILFLRKIYIVLGNYKKIIFSQKRIMN